MRTFAPSFTYANQAAEKSPRSVVAILFDTASIYITSHDDIPNVPGVVLANVLQPPSAISQRIVPDEGRSEIGSMTLQAVDVGGAVTDAFRAKLQGGTDLRGRIVELYLGYSGADFGKYELFQTQVVQNAAELDGVYTIRCADITREQRREIFDPKRTTLSASISAVDATISVVSTAAFEMVAHGTSFSDAPSATVGYGRIQDEIFRYTGKTATTFTGCTRGALNTRAVPHTVDVSVAQDQRTRVEEYIYLELPAPKLALAILTGELYNQAATLPAHWHLGIDGDRWVRESDFTGIGLDLWNPAADAVSFIARFAGLKKTDGKRFLERDVYLMSGCHPIVYSDGRMGLKRMNQVLADAPAVFEINEDNAVEWSALLFDMDGMSNHYRVDWNYVDLGSDARFTRTTEFIDATSIAIHKQTNVKSLEFKGLYGSRHTDATIRARIDALRDRYSHPPELLTVTVLPSLNPVEIGDIGRVKLPALRDYAGAGPSINRSFEVQRKSWDQASGELVFELFGSTGRAGETAPSGPGGEGPADENSLPDAWYSTEGTELSTVVDITPVGGVGVIDVGIWPLTGNPNLTNAAAIYYYLGDLELPSGATLEIANNVQLRVRGFFTVNGGINGVGRGLAGQADTPGYGTTASGLAGFLGNSRGMDGLAGTGSPRGFVLYRTLSARLTQGQFSAVPVFTLTVESGALSGLPTDLRGTSGGPGGKVTNTLQGSVIAQGGAGADGGAGLCLVTRGMSFGLSAVIDLSGDDSPTPATVIGLAGKTNRPGAGGAGSPGALLLLIDGSEISVPDLGGRFFALTGNVGAPLLNTLSTPSGGTINVFPNPGGILEGYADPAMVSDVDLSNSAYRIQYIPGAQTPAEDEPAGVPAPTGLTTESVGLAIIVSLVLPPFDQFDVAEYWASVDNNRANAVLVAAVKSSLFRHDLPEAETRWYWSRTRLGAQVSDWFPVSATGGVEGTSGSIDGGAP